jgi:hypothetical protein
MSTDYNLTLTALDGTVARITIIDSINPLPGSDTWQAESPSHWDTAGGAISSWGSGNTHLTGPFGPNSIVLDGFGKGTKKNDTGSGTKSYVDGSFPTGDFTWICTAKS